MRDDPVARFPYLSALAEEIASLAWRACPAGAWLAAAAAADVVLLGEFHPLPGACRSAMELLRALRGAGRPAVLALEAFAARDRRHLERWLARRIGGGELRRRVRWDEEWGYPWAPVLRLLSLARDLEVAVLPLDVLPRGGGESLGFRDRVFSARLAAHLASAPPGTGAVIVVGEAHLAADHLPRALREEFPGRAIVRVFHDLETDPPGPGPRRAGDSFSVHRPVPGGRRAALGRVHARWLGGEPPPPLADPGLLVHEIALASLETVGIDPRELAVAPGTWLADLFPLVLGDGERGRIRRALREGGATREEVAAFLERLDRSGAAWHPGARVLAARPRRLAAVARETGRFLVDALGGRIDGLGEFRPGSPWKEIREILAEVLAVPIDPGPAARAGSGAGTARRLARAFLSGRLPAARVRDWLLALPSRDAAALLAELEETARSPG